MSSPLEDEIGVGIGEGLQENITLDKLILTGNNFKDLSKKKKKFLYVGAEKNF